MRREGTTTVQRGGDGQVRKASTSTGGSLSLGSWGGRLALQERPRPSHGRWAAGGGEPQAGTSASEQVLGRRKLELGTGRRVGVALAERQGVWESWPSEEGQRLKAGRENGKGAPPSRQVGGR